MRQLRALRVLLRASLLGSLQYRADFAFQALLGILELAWSLVPLLVVFGQRPTIAGWRLDEALLVAAWFTGVKAVLEGVIMPSLTATIEQIRRGGFDFVLLKPVDAQLLATSGKLNVFVAGDLLGGAALLGVALLRLHHLPSPGQVAVAALLTACGLAILYAINVAALSVAFHVARIDNLAYLLESIFDAARWPSSVFRGALRLVFTFVLPLGLMTTYPPLALLGRLEPRSIAAAVLAAIVALALSRLIFLRGLAAYRSAGG